MLQAELSLGHPVIVGVYTFMDKLRGVPHWMVLVGLDDTWAWVNDPGRSTAQKVHGKYWHYSRALFDSAWTGQVVVIHPNAPAQGTINVNATLDGNSWPSGATPVSYAVTGPGSSNSVVISNAPLPVSQSGLQTGQQYTLNYSSGGPPNSTLTGISPCGLLTRGPTLCTQTLTSSGLTFTLQYSSNPPMAGFTMSSGGPSANDGQTLTLTTSTGTAATVAFDARLRSSAVNLATITGWRWTIDSTVVSFASNFQYTLRLGTHDVSLLVTDSRSAQSQPASGTVIVSAVTSGTYQILDLGTGAFSAMNNLGQLAGTVNSNQLVLWNPGGSITPLASAASGCSLSPRSLNDLGDIVGTARCPAGSPNSTAFLYTGGQFTYLSDPTDLNVNTSASGINNNRQIAGSYSAYFWSPQNCAFLITVGSQVTQGSCIGTLPNTVNPTSGASGINSQGHIAGVSSVPISYNPYSFSHAFLYDGTMLHDLGVLSGNNESSATGLNDSDHIIGTEFFFTSFSYNPYLVINGFYYDSTGLTDMGLLSCCIPGWTQTHPVAINNLGTVVGYVETLYPSYATLAAIWDTTKGLRDLDTLVPNSSGWQLTAAVAINNTGQILAAGQFGGVGHMCLLTPQ